MMADLVSSAIGARMREEDGLGRSLVLSAFVHVSGIALLVLLPRLMGLQSNAPTSLMSISLGPAVGTVESGGMTPISGRPIQRAVPTPDLPRPQPVRPPAAKPPDMVEPSKTTRPPRPPVTQAPKESSGRTPTTGPQETKGASRVDTKGAPTNETGLSTGGANGDNSATTLGTFCDPQYLGQMISLIHRNWNPQQSVVGTPIIRFIIQRDGTLTEISLKQSSGYQILDLTAQRAVVATRALPPLPACFPYSTFIVNLTFEYTR